MSYFIQGFEKRAGIIQGVKNIIKSVKPQEKIPVPNQSPPGMRINLAPKVPAPKVGPFEQLRQTINSPMNKARMYVGGTIVGAGALGYGGIKAIDWATGNEPNRPDW